MSPWMQAILPHAAPFVGVMARLGALFLFAPALGSRTIPVQIKALLVVGLTLTVYPGVADAAEHVNRLTLATVAPVVIREAVIGLLIGFIASIPVIAVQMAGLLMGQQMGLGLGTIFNPAINSEGDILGQVLFWLALSIFIVMGGVEVMHTAVVESFDRIPVGGLGAEQLPMTVLAGVLMSGYELAIRVAAPVLALIFLETIATGVLMKTVPQLNILTFGFPLKILAGLSGLVSALVAIHMVMHGEIEHTLLLMLEWARSV